MVTLLKILCDFCNTSVEEAWWYAHGSFRFRSPMGLIDAEQGEASACAQCRPFVERRDADALTAHVFAANPAMLGAADVIRPFQRLLLRNMTGAVRYARLGDPQAPRERFFEYACPCCNYRIALDRAEAREQRIVTVCPLCKARLTVGPIGHKPDLPDPK